MGWEESSWSVGIKSDLGRSTRFVVITSAGTVVVGLGRTKVAVGSCESQSCAWAKTACWM